MTTEMDSSVANVAAAMTPDGFIDFYELLGLPGTASPQLVNERINDLYSKAQSNREHRHLAKRREAEVLLDLLPHALNVLSNPDNRARYDSYAVSARAGAAPMTFEAFMNTVIKGTEETERTKGLLAMRSEQEAANAAPMAAAINNAARAEFAPAASPTSARPGVGLPLGVGVLAFVLCDVGFQLSPLTSIPLALGAAATVWQLNMASWRRTQKAPRGSIGTNA